MTIQELEIKTGPGHPWRRFFAYSLDYALYMAFINSRYNVIALYTLAASQEDFHVWNIFALSKFISDYEDNFYNPVYRDSFKNIELYQKVSDAENNGNDIKFKIIIN